MEALDEQHNTQTTNTQLLHISRLLRFIDCLIDWLVDARSVCQIDRLFDWFIVGTWVCGVTVNESGTVALVVAHGSLLQVFRPWYR